MAYTNIVGINIADTTKIELTISIWVSIVKPMLPMGY